MSIEGKISRREFLKAGVGAAAFLAELSISKEALAQLEKLLATQEFVAETEEKTIRRMRKMVFEKKEEVVWLYVKKGNREGALNILKESDETTVSTIDLAPLYEDPDVTEVILLHTHPANIYVERVKKGGLAQTEMERIIREKKSRFPLLPSGSDIVEYIADKVRLQEQKLNRTIKHVVVEPSGTWSYDVDLEHPDIKRVFFGGHIDADSQTNMVKLNWAARSVINIGMTEHQNRIFEEEGISEKNLAGLNEWAGKNWGITFNYTPFKD